MYQLQQVVLVLVRLLDLIQDRIIFGSLKMVQVLFQIKEKDQLHLLL